MPSSRKTRDSGAADKAAVKWVRVPPCQLSSTRYNYHDTLLVDELEVPYDKVYTEYRHLRLYMVETVINVTTDAKFH